MSHCYSTSFSHLALKGTCTWCAYLIDNQALNLAHIAILSAGLNASVGLVRWAVSDSDESNIGQTSRFILNVQNTLSLPLYTAEILVRLGYEPSLCLCQAVIPPLTQTVFYWWNPLEVEEQTGKFVKDYSITGNAVMLAIVSKMSNNYYGMAAATTFWLNYFIVQCDRDPEEKLAALPILDWYTYVFCLFTYLAVEAVIETSAEN